MIKINLSRVLGEKRITQKELSEKTNIRRATINAYYHEYIKRINISDLDEMCKFLECKLDDLITYLPDTDKK